MKSFLFVILSLFLVSIYAQNYAEQIHLSLTHNNPTQMVVTWSTMKPTTTFPTTYVQFYETQFPETVYYATGFETVLVDNGTLHHTQYIHRAVMTNLIPGHSYTYKVMNDTQWGLPMQFTAMEDGSWSPRFLVYGDLGMENAVSYPYLLQEAAENTVDIFVHNGDFAYDMWVDNSTFGDKWFNSMQPIMSTHPYMVSIGNHEGIYEDLNYKQRFTMPNWDNSQNLYHSWTVGLTHWIAYDTEVYVVYNAMEGHGGIHRNFGPYPEIAKAQLQFIEDDLIKANLNREKVPWIIAYGHRPMYCSDSDDEQCQKQLDSWKKDLEDLFYKYGVDLIFEAHQHSYERLWPVYNNDVYNGTNGAYNNARAPIHIVAGSAGCWEDLDPFTNGPRGLWSALRVSEYGYGSLFPANSTHLHWEQYAIRSNESVPRQVVDEIWITKDEVQPIWLR